VLPSSCDEVDLMKRATGSRQRVVVADLVQQMGFVGSYCFLFASSRVYVKQPSLYYQRRGYAIKLRCWSGKDWKSRVTVRSRMKQFRRMARERFLCMAESVRCTARARVCSVKVRRSETRCPGEVPVSPTRDSNKWARLNSSYR
jgi:hypothetical protein